MSSLNEAIKDLEYVKTEQDLVEILKTIDVSYQNTHDNAKTLLYSGVGQISEDVLSNNTIRLLDKTPAANLILSDEFTDVLKEVFISEKEANNFLYKVNGGAWDTISKRFVEATTHHELDTFIGDKAKVDRTFFQTELPAVRANENITHIDGIEKNELFKELNSLNLNNLSYNNHKKTA